MSKASKALLVIGLLIAGIVVLSWIASTVLLGMLQMDYSQAKPWTVYQFLIEQPDNKRVQDALFIAAAVSIGVTFAIVALIMQSRKESLHGDAHWATESEAKKGGLLTGDGILLGRMHGKFITLAGELFAMVAAPTRSGKGVGIVIPNLLNWPESAVVLDLKFENYEITSGFRKEHGQQVFLFNPAPRNYKTHRYNALGYISEDPNHRIDDIQKIANFLIQTPRAADPMWSAEARDLFFGIVLYLLDTPGLPVTLGEVLRQLKTEQETSEYFSEAIAERRDELAPACIASLSNFANKPPKERSGVKSTLTSALNLWSNPLIDAATSANDFDLRELRKKRMTVYIGVTPDNLARLAPLINLFVQQLIDLNTQELPARLDKKGKVLSGNPIYKHRVLLMLDEFAAIGRLEILEKAIGFVAGYGLRLVTIIQSPSQLRAVYGPDVTDTFIDNHHARVVFRPETMSEAEEIAKELGFKTVKQTTLTTPRYFGSGSGTKTASETKRQLMLPQEVKELGDEEEIILASGVRPILGRKIRYYNDKVFTKRLLGEAEIPSVAQEIHDAPLRGEITQVDLSFIYEQVPIPEQENGRELTDDEITTAADAFFDSLVEANDTKAA